MNSDVGARMLVLRKLNGWSQRLLAKRAGVPHSAISMIEHGQISPSINSLKKVLDGVPISLADFFSLDLNIQIKVFFNEKETLDDSDDPVHRWRLKTKGQDQAVEMVRASFPPGESSGDELLINKGELIGYVTLGTIELSIGGNAEILHLGDGFYFERRRPHRFLNRSDDVAEIVYTIVPPRDRRKK